MEIFLCFLLFAFGIVLVVKGGDIFVDSATLIAKALRIPTFVIGATIVSIATTLPEMIVSVMASAQGKNDMAVGNAIGSVIANIGLILAVAMICMKIVCERKKYIIQFLILIITSAILCVSCFNGYLNIAGSILLGITFVLFIVHNIHSAKTDISNVSNPDETIKTDKKTIIKNIIFFILGAIAIIIGSRLMIDRGSEIALRIGVPERIVAITLVAVGTSLPELVTTITAIVKKESSLSIGNIVGANIIDLALILPISSIASGQALPVTRNSALIDIPVCFGFVLVSILPLIVKQKSYKIQGITMIGLYVVYIVSSLML